MAEFDRLKGCIEWIDLSFVERRRTPEWATQVCNRCHFGIISMISASQILNELAIYRSHIAIHNWVQNAG